MSSVLPVPVHLGLGEEWIPPSEAADIQAMLVMHREVQEQDVVVVLVSDKPGAAARVFQHIAEAHINVRYSYLATGSRLVIASSNPQGVIAAVSE